ncbi:MAG TPA: ATP-binding cassette domain-containing protein, partial [Candidatus Peribacteria bacterium]|nr:ATP-binding cassette domain-containing protein [Candidatus Peribacteria bacterium]
LAGHLPHTGSVRTGGKIGMVFQQHAVFPWMTVRQNVAFGLPRGEHAAVEQALGLAGLTNRRDAYPHELSGGQVQRIAIARALARAPDVLLMDEPFGALDACTREQMQHWLLSVLDAVRPAVVLVTHSVEEALLLSDRILLLRDGRIAEEFTVPFRRPHPADVVYSPEFTALRRTITEALE